VKDKPAFIALSCPFCGGPPRLYSALFFGWYVQCGTCGAKAGRIQNTEREAVEIWNRRDKRPESGSLA